MTAHPALKLPLRADGAYLIDAEGTIIGAITADLSTSDANAIAALAADAINDHDWLRSLLTTAQDTLKRARGIIHFTRRDAIDATLNTIEWSLAGRAVR